MYANGPTVASASDFPSLTRRAAASSSCVSATPDKNGHVPPGSCKSYYEFYPSFGLAAAFTGLFLVVTLAHIAQAFIYRKGFCWVIIMGSLWEFGSFAIRTLGTKHQQNEHYASESSLLFALAPLWINAFVYMCAGRLMFCFLPDPHVFKIKAISIGKYFVWFDILAFIVQAAGAIMTGPGAPSGNINIGLHIYQAGIGVQQAFILFFFAMIIGFHKKMLDLEKAGHRDSHGRRWKWLTYVLYFVLTMITLRIAYRLAEFLMGLGKNNPLPTHEIYMYVLDAVPMLLALIALNAIHPGTILVGPGSDYSRGKKEFKAQRKAAKHGKVLDGDEEDGIMLHPGPQGFQNTGYAGVQHAAPQRYEPLMHGGRYDGPPLYEHDSNYA